MLRASGSGGISKMAGERVPGTLPPQVAMELDVLNQNNQHLSELLTALENKLRPILRDPRPTDDMINEKDGAALVPIAQNIRVQSVGLKDKVRFVEELISRLEI